nr:putative sugar O-methyltransferase [Polynucleobacter bastaniensis]
MSIINYLIGSRRGELRLIKKQLAIVEKEGAIRILAANEDSAIGNPMHYRHKSKNLTGRYLRHIYFYSIFEKIISRELPNDFIGLDIGSSYGVFSGLIKFNIPQSKHILVDLEGQMILAEYYLSNKFPDLKIANASDILANGIIDSEFISKYDFILVPVELFDFLKDAKVDLVTNFLSLGEMSRYWFNKYINSNVFKSSRFLFTVNRYDSAPTYNNGLTVLDYPFQNYTTIRMQNCLFFVAYVKKALLFFYKLKPHTSGVFEYIGVRK